MEKLGLYIKITNNWESFTDPLGQAEARQWYAYVNNRWRAKNVQGLWAAMPLWWS